MTMTDTERRTHAARIIVSHTEDIEVMSVWEMLDGELPESEAQADAAVEAIVDLIRAATVTVTFPGPCGHEYERDGGRQPGERIVTCDRPAGHRGEHRETDTGNTWPGGDR